MSIKGTPSTETMNDLVDIYLKRLAAGECQSDEQRMAAQILGRELKEARETARAAQAAARVLATGLMEEAKA